MNIFTSYECPVKSAQALPDNLCTKMVLESAQMLCTAHYVLDGVQKKYKPSHMNHPCSIFVRESEENYNWLYSHFVALCDEYSFRTGRVHATSSLLEELKTAPKNISNRPLSIDFMCMPDEYKKTLCVHKNYQIYLANKIKDWEQRTDKRPIVAKWTKRNKPSWYNV